MKGHIVQRTKGSFSLVVELGRHPETGKRQQKWITFTPNPKDPNGRGPTRQAQDELSKQITLVNNGDFIEPDKITVAEFFERWLTVVAEKKVGRKTLDRYRSIVRNHITPCLGQNS